MLVLSFAAGLSAAGYVPSAGAALTARPQQLPPQQTTQTGEPQDPDERAARPELLQSDEKDHPAGSATLLLTPSTLTTKVGSRLRLTLSILGAEDLRRLPVTIRFDAAVLELLSVNLGSAWNTRQQPVLLHDSSRPGELVVGLGQLARNEAGISGNAELLELELRAVAPGASQLVIDRFAAIGKGSRPQATVAVDARIIVQ